MIKLSLAVCLLLASSLAARAQGKPDACHVYLIDQKVAERAFDKLIESEDEKEQIALASAGVTILGQFSTVRGEEELTTKAFRIPRSGLFVTASVYYTDESLPTKFGGSMTLAVAVAPRPLKDALAALNDTEMEVPDSDDLDVVRVKKNVRINGRLYLVGLQCDRPQKPSSDK
ncbi:MAG: hypothetical protein M3268_04700 [Acidobacteriota bacterium]|nr:hypothetical protein [Acidobacteriota bacterium]